MKEKRNQEREEFNNINDVQERIESVKNAKYISALLTVFYLIIIIGGVFLLIVTINDLNPIILVIVLVISLTYVYLNKDEV